MKVSTEEMRSLLKTYFIMGSQNCDEDPREVLKDAIHGGITLFQFREKGDQALVGEEKIRLAKELLEICKHYQVPFIVNDDIDLALKINADGVHIGQDDEPAEQVRKKIGDKILGISAHNQEEVEAAINQGADYIGTGPVFPTETKKDTEAVQGTILVQELRKQGISIPIVGIGGITPENAASVVKGGADGVSVITAISKAKSPKEQARLLKAAVDSVMQ
ncbi:thiamine-phosphate diphosphorylase [Oceanobacillus limi]|uniref:Thiamine-phosphate synthase n=1 Tax=Oceanobacillus limi TaxID=930131 RepID=A0A1I0A8X6_9BACI|nr:thiamine phosphate synthase [Oceanobacillus limi]SES90619.1 thiamine-phosphate diphosphorylase [Oceanobacillus limi]